MDNYPTAHEHIRRNIILKLEETAWKALEKADNSQFHNKT